VEIRLKGAQLVICLLVIFGSGCSDLPPVIAQEPENERHGCAPEHAYVGLKAKHQNGRTVTIERVAGASPQCSKDRRPTAVEISYED
jgi:hypothetical protein